MTGMDASAALARWHAVVESRDPAGLPDLIAEGAVFRSPAVHTPQVGRDTVVGYLTAAFTVLGPALTYEREWLGEDSAVLQFRTEVGGLDVSGVDMVTWDEDGKIVDFTVMVRPRRPSTPSSSTWAPSSCGCWRRRAPRPRTPGHRRTSRRSARGTTTRDRASRGTTRPPRRRGRRARG